MPGAANVEQYLNIEDVTARLRVSRSTVWRWLKNGNFAKPIHLGPKAVRWRESDIAAWSRERAEAEPAVRANNG